MIRRKSSYQGFNQTIQRSGSTYILNREYGEGVERLEKGALKIQDESIHTHGVHELPYDIHLSLLEPLLPEGVQNILWIVSVSSR